MALTIQTNQLAMTAQRALEKVEARNARTIQKLATGSRVVTAADDPAGLALADNMNSSIRSLSQAQHNSQDAMSLIQVFEGGTNEINNMLIRVRELSMQSASDTMGDRERSMLNQEVQELKSEITRVARTTSYLGRELLAGDSVRLEFQVGINNDPEKDRIIFDPGNTDLTSSGLDVDGIDVSSRSSAQGGLETLDEAIIHVNELRARIGSAQNRLQVTYNSQGIYKENLITARSRVADADIAEETTNLVRDNIIRQAGVSVLAQANAAPQLALQLLR